jgi:hypothetical protein
MSWKSFKSLTSGETTEIYLIRRAFFPSLDDAVLPLFHTTRNKSQILSVCELLGRIAQLCGSEQKFPQLQIEAMA